MHDQEEIVFLRVRFPKSRCFTIMLLFDDVFFEGKSRFDKSLHDFVCKRLIESFSSRVTYQDSTKFSRLQYSKAFKSHFFKFGRRDFKVMNYFLRGWERPNS